jgi:hypothetical protein
MHTSHKNLSFLGALLIAGGIGLAMAADRGNQEPIRLSREACASLQGFSIAGSAIGLPELGRLGKGSGVCCRVREWQY